MDRYQQGQEQALAVRWLREGSPGTDEGCQMTRLLEAAIVVQERYGIAAPAFNELREAIEEAKQEQANEYSDAGDME